MSVAAITVSFLVTRLRDAQINPAIASSTALELLIVLAAIAGDDEIPT